MKMSKKLSIVIALLASILLVPMAAFAEEPGSDLSGMSGTAATGINLQNVSSTATNATVKLIPQSGGSEITIAEKAVPALSAINYYMPDYDGTNQSPNVPSGTYSLVATADQPLEAIVRTDYSDTKAAGIYSSVTPGSDVIVPLIMNNWNGQTSHFTVQNANSTSAATVDIELFGPGKTDAYASDTGVSLAAGASKTYKLGEAPFNPENNGEAVSPGSGIEGFLGFIQVTATSSSASQDIVVQSFIDIGNAGALGAFSGVAADSAKTELYIPLIRSNFFGDTGIQLVNPNATAASGVKITFYTDKATSDLVVPGNGYADSYEQTVDVDANGSLAIFQGFAGTSRTAGLPGGSQTGPANTNDGWIGVAKVVSPQPLLAVVNDSTLNASWGVDKQSTYNAATSDDAGTKFALPLVRGGFLDGWFLTTGVQVQNTTSSDITCSITYNASTDGNEYAGKQNQTITANGALNFYQGAGATTETIGTLEGVPGWYGSAIVDCSGNVVLVVDDSNGLNLESGAGATVVVDSANYNGLKVE